MSDVIGRLVSVGYGIEATYGTAVAPSNWLGKLELSFFEREENILNESAFNHIAKNSGVETLRVFGEGSLTTKVFDEGIGGLLLLFCGQDATSSANGTAYDHEFAMLNTNEHASATLAIEEGAITDQRFPGAMPTSFSFQIAVDDFFKVETGFVSQAPASASNTPSFAEENEFVPKHAKLKVVSAGGDLDAASAIADVRAITLEVNKNLIRKETVGNNTIQLKNGALEANLSIEMYYNALTFRNYRKNKTGLSVRVEVENTDVVLDTGVFPRIWFDIPLAKVTNWEPDYSNDELIMQTVEMEVLLDLADPAFITANLTNAVATYVAP